MIFSVSVMNLSPACVSAPVDPRMVDTCIRILVSWLFNEKRGGKVPAFRLEEVITEGGILTYH